MTNVLLGKRIILGVTGSIACYKALDLASTLTQHGAFVDTILTESALQFLHPIVFRSLTHRRVITDIFDSESGLGIQHVTLGQEADIMVIAPATANTIAKLASGLADDPIGLTVLATRAPIIIVPAMDAGMYDHPSTQENLKKLQVRGLTIIGPSHGYLASGLVGIGRLVDIPVLLGHIRGTLGRDGDLKGRRIVITAGGTQEPIDPVRILTNRSSGKMGYSIAEAARDRGASVTLVATPTALGDLSGVDMIRVSTAQQMRKYVLQHEDTSDVLIMAAAVADYRSVAIRSQKIKKNAETWNLKLVKTQDILQEARGFLVKVGFAAESQDLVANALRKLKLKGVNFMVANNISSPGSGFGSDTNQAVIVNSDGQIEELALLPKADLADQILNRVVIAINRHEREKTS